MATMAPEDVEMLTPGGIGATLSPASVIFLTTMPAKGARMVVKVRLASCTSRFALAWSTAACRQCYLGFGSVVGILRDHLVAVHAFL